MNSDSKRPVWVWVIFIWFTLAGLLAIYKFYTIAIGTAAMPEGIDRPTSLFYYVRAFGFQVLSMAAAIFLFLRKEIAKWLFSVCLGLSVVSSLYTFTFGVIPNQHQTMLIAVTLISLSIYSAITWYTFKLKDTGYYFAKNT